MVFYVYAGLLENKYNFYYCSDYKFPLLKIHTYVFICEQMEFIFIYIFKFRSSKQKFMWFLNVTVHSTGRVIFSSYFYFDLFDVLTVVRNHCL